MLRNIINVFFAALVVAIPPLLLAPTGDSALKISDFRAYYVAARIFASGNGPRICDPEYQVQEQKYYLPAIPPIFVSDPPYFLVLLTPLAFLTFPVAKIVFSSVLLVLLAVSIVLLAHILKYNNRQTLLLIAAAALSGPIFEALRVSKPSPLFLFGLCMSIYFLNKGSDVKAGAFAALCLLKPQGILPFLAFAAGSFRLRFLISFGITATLLILLTFPAVGTECYHRYFQLISFLNTNPEVAGSSSMPTIKGQLLRLSTDQSLAVNTAAVLFAITCTALFVLGLSTRKNSQWWVIGVIAAFSLAIPASPYMHMYDLIIMLPTSCLLFRWAFTHEQKSIAAVWACALIPFLLPIYVLVHYFYLIGSNAIVNVHLICTLAMAAAALCLATKSTE